MNERQTRRDESSMQSPAATPPDQSGAVSGAGATSTWGEGTVPLRGAAELVEDRERIARLGLVIGRSGAHNESSQRLVISTRFKPIHSGSPFTSGASSE
jgi:hypothetical protein